MKTNLNSIIFISTAATLLSGCASYISAPLNTLSSEAFVSSSLIESSGLSVSAKAFDKMDCKRYLDRDVISKGYQPIQLYIENNTDKSYLFSLDRINLPYAHLEEVAEKVHTSTISRILWYGIPGLVLLWPLVIPAVVDGVKSSEANELLDYDFASKIARNQTIAPYSHLNKIIFVPINGFQPSFDVTLIDPGSKESKTFNVAVI